MDFYKVPIGFGMALAQNEAAMLRYAQLSEKEKTAFWTRPTTFAANGRGIAW